MSIPAIEVLFETIMVDVRLNLVREFISLGLIPTAIIYDGNMELFSIDRLTYLTEIVMEECQVVFHPSAITKVLGCHADTWCRWAMDAVDSIEDDTDLELTFKMSPSLSVHKALKDAGVIQGNRRSALRFIDLNMLVYLVATRTEPWKEATLIQQVNEVKTCISLTLNLHVNLLPESGCCTLTEADIRNSTQDIEAYSLQVLKKELERFSQAEKGFRDQIQSQEKTFSEALKVLNATYEVPTSDFDASTLYYNPDNSVSPIPVTLSVDDLNTDGLREADMEEEPQYIVQERKFIIVTVHGEQYDKDVDAEVKRLEAWINNPEVFVTKFPVSVTEHRGEYLVRA